ncbi:MAG: type IV pilus modification protein PilV [Aquabacterium sp.]|uniref:type IV pilus modification protein PilV n=1 Tax=Aquabacterium sp. TaxID=1872578 RepID=UPI0025C1AAB2|nr:type IV pilus modification protein PilV [Aquabacterium sp.]MBI3381239.1 type IV pilus modification protein PilV [Aquabacterium sp.]
MMTFLRPMRRQRGATLIEVLVSILLLALGVLAMAAMQANAVQFGKTSEFRSLATLLANDLADRMRANHPASADMKAYNLTDAYSRPTQAPADAQTACTGTTKCTFDQMAAYDLAQWRRNVYDQLPEGTAYVSVEANASKRDAADIWIAWTDPSSASGTENTPAVDTCPTSFKQPAQVRCMYFHVVL